MISALIQTHRGFLLQIPLDTPKKENLKGNIHQISAIDNQMILLVAL